MSPAIAIPKFAGIRGLLSLIFLELVGCSRFALGGAPLSSFPPFSVFLSLYSRTYEQGSVEHETRRVLYEQRVADAEKHNAKAGRRWTAGVNDFWDWKESELKVLRGNIVRANKQHHDRVSPVFGQMTGDLPEKVDYVGLNATSRIFDQGRCGSCWAIASATVLAAHTEIHTQLQGRTFSVQELVSCIPNPQHCGGTGGCGGATIEMAFEYATKNGLSDATQVPYQAVTGICEKHGRGNMEHSLGQLRGGGALTAGGSHSAGTGTDFGMQNWEKLPENKYWPLMHALVEKGPVGVSVAASGWFSYRLGIFDSCVADAVVDHAVVMMGYGYDDTLESKYWLLQNSWGRKWGESGMMRMLRRDDDDTHCGTDHQPELGSGCRGGPTSVTVCGMCGILYDSAVPLFGAHQALVTQTKAWLAKR